MEYFIIIVLLFIIELLYFKIAKYYNIIDKPNNRSSHTQITLKGGGVIFPVGLFIAFLLGHASLLLTIAVISVAIISFIGDVRPLSTLPRFLIQFIAMLLIFYDQNLFRFDIGIILVMVVFLLGWINAFNFMDGINGITVLYATLSLITFSYLPVHKNEIPLILIMLASCLVFGFFNIRTKVKTFAGDVGSISMAVVLGYFMIQSITKTGHLGYILFFAVYGIDAVVTILFRIKNKENILLPHRSHLYQYLANEMKKSHLSVSFWYTFIQLLINILTIYLIEVYDMTWFGTFLILIFLTGIYLIIRSKVQDEINRSKKI